MHMTHSKLAVVAVALLGIIAIASYAAAHVLSGDAEVRISARRLDDGRTEFALQQRTDGEWAERMLPRARYFPANPSSDRWLNSSPLTIETAGHESDDKLDEELRSAKEELARTQAELKTATKSLEEASTELAKHTAPIVRELGENSYDNGRIITDVSATDRRSSGVLQLDTVLRVVEDNGRLDDELPLELVVECIGGGVRYWLRPLPMQGISQEVGFDEYELTYSLDGVSTEHSDIASGSSRWYGFDASYYFGSATNPVWMTELPLPAGIALHSATTFEVTVTGADDESITATFSLDGVWDTPVQPNIDRCGEYY